jgi:hypothetical protein
MADKSISSRLATRLFCFRGRPREGIQKLDWRANADLSSRMSRGVMPRHRFVEPLESRCCTLIDTAKLFYTITLEDDSSAVRPEQSIAPTPAPLRLKAQTEIVTVLLKTAQLSPLPMEERRHPLSPPWSSGRLFVPCTGGGAQSPSVSKISTTSDM